MRVRRETAVALGYRERRTQARQHLTSVADIQQETLGPEHPETLTTQHEIVLLLRGQGHRAAAETLGLQVIESRSRILGPDHPDTLISRFYHAYTLDGQGRHAEAEGIYRSVLAAQTRTLGAEHTHTLDTHNELVDALLGQGRYAEAESMAGTVLRSRTRALGPAHPDTLATRVYLCDAINGQGRYAEQDDMRRNLLTDQLRALGPDSSFTPGLPLQPGGKRPSPRSAPCSRGSPPGAGQRLRAAFRIRLSDTLYARHKHTRAIAAQGRHADAESRFRTILADLTVPDHTDDTTRPPGKLRPVLHEDGGDGVFACTDVDGAVATGGGPVRAESCVISRDLRILAGRVRGYSQNTAVVAGWRGVWPIGWR